MHGKPVNNTDALFGIPLFPEADNKSALKNDQSQKIIQKIENIDINKVSTQLLKKNEHFWLDKGRKRALLLFHAASKYVPAYKDFLNRHSINTQKINNISDFEQVPPTNKENYIQAYPLSQLMWHGNPSLAQNIVASSGSTGEANYWPRGEIYNLATDHIHEVAIESHFELKNTSTLAIVCFAMGVHIAGTTTFRSFLHLHQRGYPITTISPGYVTENILKIVKNLSGNYSQIILAGYPPFIKEIIDKGYEHNINWKKINIRFLLAGEGFNESWRTYMSDLTNADPQKDFISIYGSADASAMGIETKASITIRRKLSMDLKLNKKIFDDERIPTLYQYFPEQIYFESVDHDLILTSSNSLPLIRYNIYDEGNILTQSQIEAKYPVVNKIVGRLKKNNNLLNLPFVYVFGRSNHTIVIYGANIYLEQVREALEHKNTRNKVTGKIIMYIKNDKKFNSK